MRQVPNGKIYQNRDIDSSLSHRNYSLINRGNTAEAVNDYRKKIEKDIFKYNRKNLVHAVEVVIQCPADCPPEQEERFFQETFNFFCNRLPMGEACIISADVHCDEKFYDSDGNLISKNHLHLLFVPAVFDAKHKDFDYKLCADELTKKGRLKALHPDLQSYLIQKNITATVYSKSSGSEKKIALSVSQLKEITNATGITLKKSLTLDQLIEIIKENQILKEKIKSFEQEKNHRGWRSDRTSAWGQDDRSERNSSEN